MCMSTVSPRSQGSLCVALLACLVLAGCGGGPKSPGSKSPGAGLGGYDGASADVTHGIPSFKPAKSAFTTTQPQQFPIHGVDVSKYQGDIDWRAVRASGTRFAFIKATEGSDHVDAKFRQNWDGAKAAGVARGAYHFMFWCRSPAQEFANFARTVPLDPDALPPVLDVEATPTSRSCTRRLERGPVLRDMHAMLREMERRYGKKPVIYTTVDFYEAILAPNEMAEYPIWVRSTKHSPQVRYGSRKWHLWQYQSDGEVAGIRSKVDRNAFYGSSEQWAAFAGNPTATPVRTAFAAPDEITPASKPAPVRAPTPRLAPAYDVTIPGAAPTTIAGLIEAPAARPLVERPSISRVPTVAPRGRLAPVDADDDE